MLMTFSLLSLPSPPSPIFEVGPFTLRYYGLFIALGLALGTLLTAHELVRKGHEATLALDALVFVVPLGFIGARIYHVVTDYELYADAPFPSIFEVWNGGLGIYGAVLGGFLGGFLFARIRGISPLVLADAIAPGLVLAQAIGRWGNYFNQELFGRPSNLPWAIQIDPENRPVGFKEATSFHPTFFYEFVWNLLVCLLLLWVTRRFASKLKNGDIFFMYVSLYSLGRFFVEALRIDPAFQILGTSIRGNLFTSSILAIGFALILFLRHSRTSRNRSRS